MIDFSTILNYFVPFVTSFLLTLIFVLIALKLFPKIGLMDRPWKYGLKRAPIPYYGGITMFLAFVICVLIFLPINKHVIGMLIGIFMITGISFLDDLFSVKPIIRLAVQILAALSLVFFDVGIKSISNPFGGALNFDQWNIILNGVAVVSVIGALFTIIWIVSVVNTMNFLDGLNGLPSGVTVIASLALFLLSVRPGIHFDAAMQMPVAIMSVVLFGSSLAFWIFDFYPAKILMGDTGSMFLGFVLATLAIFSGGKVATAVLVMGFPLLDACWVILRRILEGHSPMKGDLKHFHHRLLYVGFSEREALLLIYSMCAVFGIAAVFLNTWQKLIAVIILFIAMCIAGYATIKFSKKK